MSHGSVHEEAEHASHARQDPFDRRVAMTMVVVAALLAGVKIIGHRAHNAMLSYQITASNDWAYFQAKKNRQYLYESQAELLANLARKGELPAALAPEDDLFIAAEAKKEGGHKEEPKPKKKKKELSEEERKEVEHLVETGVTRPAAERSVAWKSQAKGYEEETASIQKKAEHNSHLSELHHHQAGFFDLGELFVELALVLCSVGILVKRPGFWYGGMGVCGVGLVLVVVGFLVH